MKTEATVLKSQLAWAFLLAVLACGLPASGQNTPYYGWTNFAGLPGTSGSADGTNTTARFNGPFTVGVDPSGNVFAADYMNSNIRKISPEGIVTTFAGVAGAVGSTDGTNNTARFTDPQGVATDNAGNVYVADTFNSTIRKITPAGVVTTLAGLAGTTGSADGTNTAARFFYPCGLTVDSSGNIYVADYYNCSVRKVTQAGVVTTLAGLAGVSGSADGTNSTARFYRPGGVATDAAGNVFVADTGNYTIRKITPAGVVTTLAGAAAVTGYTDGTNSNARFATPYSVAVDTNGNVFVADCRTVRKVSAAGVVTTIGGLGSAAGNVDGTNSQARFNQLSGIALDSAGNLYVSDWTANRVVKGTPNYPPPPIIGTTNPLPTGTAGIIYSTTLTATGGTMPYTWTIDAGGLPTGLILSSGGVISGTPTAATNATVIIKATGANGAYSTRTFTLVVYTPPSITTGSLLPPGVSGAAYSQALVGSGGQPPYTWSLASGSLPAGLSLSPDGVISGAPTTPAGSSFSIALTANNGAAVTNNFTLAINQGVPLTEDFEHGGAIPSGWTQEYVTGTVGWVFQKGGNNNKNPANAHSGLYNGLLYNSAATDHQTKLVTPMIDFGTNTAAQLTFWVDTKLNYLYIDNMAAYYKTNATAPWTLLGYYQHDGWIQVTYSLPTPGRTYYIGFEGDARGGYGVLIDDVSVIAVAPPAAPVILSGSKLPTGTVGTPYSQTLSASGGTAPYTWAVSSGTLPSGLSLSPAGVLNGTPTLAGNASVEIRVAGGDSIASTNVFDLAINRAPSAADPSYAFTNFVGQAGGTGGVDGTNSAARFSSPVGVCVDTAGNLFVGDSWNHTVRKVTPGGVVTTLAGLAGMSGTNDGVGNAARFFHPAGVAVDTNGLVYVADENNDTIRMVTPGGSVSTLAGTPGRTGIDPEDPNWYCFWEPTGVAVGDGNCYVADTVNNTIAKIAAPSRALSILAGYYEGSADGTGLNAQFLWPQGLALSQGTFYVADTGNRTIRKITTGGVTTTLAGSPGLSGSADGTNGSARFMTPYAAAVDQNGNLFVVDRDNHNIRKITPAGVVTTIGGCAGVAGTAEDVGIGARFDSPQGIAVDSAGVLYIADTGNNRIVKGTPIAPAGGMLTLLTNSITVSEAGGAVTLTVTRTSGSGGAIGCNYTTVDGSALAGTDYTATNGVLSWADGEAMPQSITLHVLSNNVPGSARSFTVQIAGVAVGNPSSTTVTILGAPITRLLRCEGNLDFGNVLVNTTASHDVILHNDGNSPLTVSSILYSAGFSGAWSGIIPSGGAQTVTVTFSPTAAQDYTGLFAVQADVTSAYTALAITGTGIIPPTGTLQLLTSAASVSEGAGSLAVTVTRTGGSFGPLACDYTTANGSALAGSDYTATNGTLNWADGDTASKSIRVPIIDDSLVEGAETFNINLSGAPVGTPASMVVTILDNDVPTMPVLTSFTPASGAPGVSVTLNGTNFYTVTAVKFGGVAAAFTNNSSARITAVVPAAATNGPITVITPGGTAISSNTFTVLETFSYTTNAGTITITGYNGPNGAVVVPDTINGLPVTSIGAYGFYGCGITSVVIPDSVTSIGDRAFQYCSSLVSVSLGNHLATIGFYAFISCSSLTSITFPSSLTDLGYITFTSCPNLRSVYFKGNPPEDVSAFFLDSNAVIYYVRENAGWDTTYSGQPTVLWKPQVQNLGMQANQPGFTITGASNLVIVVEACTNLTHPAWFPVATNTLTGGSAGFSDPQWTNYPGRFYRLRSP